MFLGKVPKLSKSVKIHSANNSGRRKYLTLATIALFILTIGGVYVYLSRDKNANDKVAETVCDDETLGKAAIAIIENKVKDLITISEEIKKLPGYDQDPNCLYAVTNRYVLISDYDNAKSSFENLKSVYSEEVGLSPQYNSNESTIMELEQKINFLENLNNKVYEENAGQYGPEYRP